MQTSALAPPYHPQQDAGAAAQQPADATAWGTRGPTPEEVRAAFSDQPGMLRPLARWLLPVVDQKVMYVLRPIALQKRRDLTMIRQDLVQDLLVEFLRDDGKLLRQWDPERGCTILSFIGLVTRCYIHHRFRRFKGNPWASEPVSAEEMTALVDDGVSLGPNLVEDLEHRQRLEQLHQKFVAQLSPRDQARFAALFVQQRSPAEVAADEGVTENAIHQWSSRIVRKIRGLFEESGEGGRAHA